MSDEYDSWRKQQDEIAANNAKQWEMRQLRQQAEDDARRGIDRNGSPSMDWEARQAYGNAHAETTQQKKTMEWIRGLGSSNSTDTPDYERPASPSWTPSSSMAVTHGGKRYDVSTHRRPPTKEELAAEVSEIERSICVLTILIMLLIFLIIPSTRWWSGSVGLFCFFLVIFDWQKDRIDYVFKRVVSATGYAARNAKMGSPVATVVVPETRETSEPPRRTLAAASDLQKSKTASNLPSRPKIIDWPESAQVDAKGLVVADSSATVQNPHAPRMQANGVSPTDPATWGKVARNTPCPCGSGKRHKECHGKI